MQQMGNYNKSATADGECLLLPPQQCAFFAIRTEPNDKKVRAHIWSRLNARLSGVNDDQTFAQFRI
jgi:hypothetical protein